MAALTQNTSRGSRGNLVPKAYPVAAGQRIFQGAITMVDDDGFLREAVALANNLGSPGVALEECDNSSGANGDKWCVVGSGLVELPVTSTAQSEVGNLVYASTDNDTSDSAGANEPLVGVIEEFISSSKALVRVGPLAATRALAT